MQKWIMSGLLFFACAFAIVLMFTLPGKEDVAKQESPTMPEVTLNADQAEGTLKANCISCHGDQLQGAVGPSLQNIGATYTDEQIYKIVSKGKGGMPAFGGRLQDEEIANLAHYLAEKK